MPDDNMQQRDLILRMRSVAHMNLRLMNIEYWSPHSLYVHLSKIKGLRSTFFPRKILQNLLCLCKKKTDVFFFILHFEQLSFLSYAGHQQTFVWYYLVIYYSNHKLEIHTQTEKCNFLFSTDCHSFIFYTWFKSIFFKTRHCTTTDFIVSRYFYAQLIWDS